MNELLAAIGKYAMEKGEAWRLDEGLEIMEAYAAAQAGRPKKAWCDNCNTVTPCDWRPNSATSSDLCCSTCDSILVCVHEFAGQAAREEPQ